MKDKSLRFLENFFYEYGYNIFIKTIKAVKNSLKEYLLLQKLQKSSTILTNVMYLCQRKNKLFPIHCSMCLNLL